MQVLTNADEDDEGWEDEATLNERRLLSRYGVWLLVRFSFESNLSSPLKQSRDCFMKRLWLLLIP
jgi:hypothetical protein